MCHYYGTANKTYFQELQKKYVKYKKYFYALRPLLAARYIEENGESAPVLFSDLMNQELPRALREEIETVLAVKQALGEGERRLQNAAVRQFIEEELRRQKQLADQMKDDRNNNWEALNRVFLEFLKEEQRQAG